MVTRALVVMLGTVCAVACAWALAVWTVELMDYIGF
jgi:hypothetical protein